MTDVESLAEAPHSFNRDIMRHGDEGIRRLATLWPPTARLRELVRDSVARYDARTSGQADPAMGFDAYRAVLPVSEVGYLWCTIEAVQFRGELALARTRCSWWVGARQHEEDAACLLRRYGGIFAELGMTIEGDEASSRVAFPEVVARMDQARLEKLGGLQAHAGDGSDGSDVLRHAEAFLSDPLARISVGRFAGRSAEPGDRNDYEAARALVDARALHALRRVLRGPHPEGRAFAAIGLSSLGALSPEDQQAIAGLAGSSSIRFQGGCMVTFDSAASFYAKLSKFHWLFEDRRPR